MNPAQYRDALARTEELQKKLTAKERAFVEEYLVDLNGTQAAIRAGYSAKSAAVSPAPGSLTSWPRSRSPTSARSGGRDRGRGASETGVTRTIRAAPSIR